MFYYMFFINNNIIYLICIMFDLYNNVFNCIYCITINYYIKLYIICEVYVFTQVKTTTVLL